MHVWPRKRLNDTWNILRRGLQGAGHCPQSLWWGAVQEFPGKHFHTLLSLFLLLVVTIRLISYFWMQQAPLWNRPIIWPLLTLLCERLQYWDSYSCWYLILWSKKCLRNLETETEHRKEEPLNFSQSFISDLTFDFSALKLRWRTTTIRGWVKVFFVPLLQYRRRDSTQLVTQQKSQLVLSSAKYVGDLNQCVKKCSS